MAFNLNLPSYSNLGQKTSSRVNASATTFNSLRRTPPKSVDTSIPGFTSTKSIVQPGGGQKGQSNPSNLWSSRTSNVVGAVADIGTSLFQNNSRVADQSNTTKTLNTTYDTTSSALMSSGNPYAMMAGAIMKGAGLASDALTAAGVGTDQMTGIDKVLDSKWLKLTPPGLINALGASSTQKFAKDEELQELQGDAYADTYGDIDSAAAHAGKKYGLFSKHSKKKWDSKINYARLNQNNIEGINEANQDAIAAGNYEGLAIGNQNVLNGGVQTLRLGKHGMKVTTLSWAKNIVKAQKGISLNTFSPILPFNFKISDFKGIDFPGQYDAGRTIKVKKGDASTEGDKGTTSVAAAKTGETTEDNPFMSWDLTEKANTSNKASQVHNAPIQSIKPQNPIKQEKEDDIQPIQHQDPDMQEKDDTIQINNPENQQVPEDIQFYEANKDRIGSMLQGVTNFNAIAFVEGLSKYSPDSFEGQLYAMIQKSAKDLEIDPSEVAAKLRERYGVIAQYKKDGGVIIVEEAKFLKEGGSFNVIPEGALHKNKHNMDNAEGLTKKGIPVVTEEDGKLVQQAEIEREELIFRLEVTKKLEELKKKQEEAESEEEKAKIAIEAGKLLVKEILHNTEDNTGLIEQVE